MLALNLTPKQEAFCQVYVETGNASEAYRRCYNTSKMKDKSVWEKASELLANVKVKARVRELALIAQKVQQEKFEITIETVTRMLIEDRKLAREVSQVSAAVSASKAIAQIHGLVIDRKEVGKPGEFAELEDMSDADLAAIARGSSSGTVAPKDGAPRSSQLH